MTEKNIPIGQAAEFLGVSIDTVRRWDEKGILHSTRPDGKDRYFSVTDLEKVKFSQPLTISEAAQKLDISEVTLRRLEEKGLITPDRDTANNRIYTLKCLENFIKSDYFLRRQEIEDKILDTPETAETKTSDYQNDLKSLSDQHRVLSAEIQKHNDHLGKLNRFRKTFYAGLIIAGTSLLILTAVATLFFIAYPEKTGRWFGLYSIKAVAGSSNKTSEGGEVLGASFTSPKLVDSNILGKIFQPIGGLSLEITKRVSPDSYNRVVGQQAIADVNDVLGIDVNKSVVSKYNLTFPDSSYLIIPDNNLIKNLNADYIRGKVPGTGAGDLAFYNEQGKIVGVESNTGAEIIAFDTPMTYNSETKTLSISYSTDNLKTENGQLTTIQGISTTATPTFAGITIGGINGLLIAANGKVSSINNNSADWDSAYSHTTDTTNPHNVTSTQILPNQGGQNGKILGTNGTNVVWTTNSMGVAWGAITGTLSDQGDLNIALGGKEATLIAGLASQYYRGDKTWQTLNATAVGLGSVENTALSTWAGSANITTLGTVATGTWNATAIGDSKISSSSYWNTAYGWGNHAVAGYFIKASDDLDDVAAGITNVHLTTTLKSNYDTAYSHTSLTNNPHSVTATQVGLGSVDNTSDANKSVLSATKLTTARAINGVDFDGTAPITIYDATKVSTSTTVNGKALSGNITLDTSDIADAANKRYVTDAQLVVIGNTSGTNTGDETQLTIKTKLGVASAGVDGYLTGADWTTFNSKESTISAGLTSQYYRGDKTWQTLDKSAVGLGSVENTALSTWAGSANITTLGTIIAGTWNGTAIGDGYISSAANWNTAFSHTSLTNNPHSVTQTQVGLSNVVNSDTTTTANITDSLNKRFVSDANLLVIGNTSGTNTGDQTLVGLGGVPTTTTVNGHPLSANVTVTATDLGLGSVENTALSTWAGTSNITTLGTVATGTWNATAIGDSKISSSSYWNTAYGWGNHAVAGYFIKASDDLDDVAAGITNVHLTTTLKSNYDTAYSHTSLTNNPHSVTATQVGLGNVENTALSTWAGTSNITTLGTIIAGTWNGTAIGDGYISSALTGKTYNGLTLTAVANGFTIAGGTTSKTLTVPLDASVSGTNTGDQDLSTINKFKIEAGDTTTGYFEDKIYFGASISVLDASSGGSLSKYINTIQDIRTSDSPTFSGLALGVGNLTMTGSLGATDARLTKGWFTDLQVTRAISGSVTGNAGTVTGLSVASGKTLTASNTLTLTSTDGASLAIGGGGTLGTGAYATIGDYAAVGQTFYIGTTQVAINRASNPLTLAGLTLTTPNIGAALGDSLGIGGALVGIASFHGSEASHDSFFGGAYGNTLNFDSEVNADTGAGYVNFYGYQGGITKFRDFHIANGKGTSIAFFDGSSGNVGIGTTAPASTLSAWGGASGGGFELMRFNAANVNGPYVLLGHPYNSTVGNYGYLPVNSEEGKILAQSYNGSTMSTSAGIYFKADQQHEANKIGTRIELATTPNNSTAVPTVRFVVDNAGHITLEGVTSTGATGTGKFVFDTAPTITGATLGAFNHAVDAQASDTYVVTLSPVPASLTTGMIVIFKANTVNTGAATLNVNGLGAKTIVKRLNTALSDGDILAGMYCHVIYDGTNFVITNPVTN